LRLLEDRISQIQEAAKQREGDIASAEEDIRETEQKLQSLEKEKEHIVQSIHNMKKHKTAREKERVNLQGELERLRTEEEGLKERVPAASRISTKGHDPDFIVEISKEDLAKLNDELDEMERIEAQMQAEKEKLRSFVSRFAKEELPQAAPEEEPKEEAPKECVETVECKAETACIAEVCAEEQALADTASREE
jgi:DNA repair exonuclease SbcCD ATPase subunit